MNMILIKHKNKIYKISEREYFNKVYVPATSTLIFRTHRKNKRTNIGLLEKLLNEYEKKLLTDKIYNAKST